MKVSKHLLFILLIITIAVLIVLGIKYHGAIQHFWLWLIGLTGGIVEIAKGSFQKLRAYFKADTPVNPIPAPVQKQEASDKAIVKAFPEAIPLKEEKMPDDKTTVIKVLRYIDDTETTLGLLYIDNEFYCYTLEDTYHEVKVKGKTRIPAGTYNVDFIKQLTPLTLLYRKTRDWFDYHLEIKDVPGFTGVYIHNGGTSADTEGCLLVANGITSNDTAKTLTNSRQTFEDFYKLIGTRLRNNYTVTITIYNENWIDKLNT